jgi:hypothetical protein
VARVAEVEVEVSLAKNRMKFGRSVERSATASLKNVLHDDFVNLLKHSKT